MTRLSWGAASSPPRPRLERQLIFILFIAHRLISYFYPICFKNITPTVLSSPLYSNHFMTVLFRTLIQVDASLLQATCPQGHHGDSPDTPSSPTFPLSQSQFSGSEWKTTPTDTFHFLLYSMNVLLLSEMNVILYTETKIDDCKCCHFCDTRMMIMMRMLLLMMIMTIIILSLNNYVTHLLRNIICICETSPLLFVAAMLL